MNKPFALRSTDDGAVLEIYGEIGGWGVTAQDVAAALSDVEGDLLVRCSSPGGDAFEGVAVMNLLRAFEGTVTGVIEGYAASAASIVMTGGCDHLIMRPSAELMIHNAWTWGDGDSSDLRRVADDLDRMNAKMAEIYAERSGGDPVSFLEAMARETWYTADEAVAAGLADEVRDGRDAPVPVQSAARVRASFKYRGRAEAPAPVLGADMNLKMFAQRLGCAEDADEATVLAALDEALAEQAAAEEPAEVPEETPEETPVESEKKKEEASEESEESEEGESESDLVVTIDAAALEELREQAAYGAAARARDEQAGREEVIDAAIRDNRISVSARARWLAAMEADPEGTREKLSRIPKDLIPRAELGHNSAQGDATITKKIAPRNFGAVNV
ncbi:MULTISPECIES: head maturation protease, ClpP-related [Corynebacterium]|uniref:head maturation protease, ClpP-related n=1 Tax=Corynebacterium TaxID=1716 RepID=UPI00178C39CB|nr:MULTISPECIES: head maturation protease, ClpP-related [Corynebacterium]